MITVSWIKLNIIQILLTLLLINPNAIFSSLWYHYHIIILYHTIICRSVIPSYEYKVKHKGNYKVDTVFDRSTAMIALTSKMSMETFAPNPLRKTTFDLLLLLALHESIHRVLREYRDSADEIEKAVSFEWLREYYTDRVDDYFDGFQYLGRAEDFIEELLLVPPSVINIDGGTRTAVVDTQKIASDLVEMRSLVFLDWRDIIQRVPEEHVALRQCVLVQQAKGWAENIASSELDAVGGEDSLGAFEWDATTSQAQFYNLIYLLASVASCVLVEVRRYYSSIIWQVQITDLKSLIVVFGEWHPNPK